MSSNCKFCCREIDTQSIRNNPCVCPDCKLCTRCCMKGLNPSFYNCIVYSPFASDNGFFHVKSPQNNELFKQRKLEETTFVENRSKRFLGCELECNGLDSYSPCTTRVSSFFDNKPVYGVTASVYDHNAFMVSDGSVSHGFEVVTFPANGDSFLKQIRGLCKGIQEFEPVLDSQCGYHLHVDCKDYNTPDLLNFIRLYYLIEPALFKVVPESRQNNHFCRPLQYSIKELMIHDISPGKRPSRSDFVTSRLAYGPLSTSTIRQRKTQQKPGNRYFALNTTSWFYRGTVEIRLAAGTFDSEKITEWAMFWANMADLAKDHFNSLSKLRQAFLPVFQERSQLTGVCKRSVELAWKVLMRLCPNDKNRAWFTKRLNKFSPGLLSNTLELQTA